MSPEIVRSQLNSGKLACLFHDKSCCRISNREYLVAGFDALILDVLMQPISNPLRDEYYFSLLSALWSPKDQLLIDDIFRGECGFPGR